MQGEAGTEPRFWPALRKKPVAASAAATAAALLGSAGRLNSSSRNTKTNRLFFGDFALLSTKIFQKTSERAASGARTGIPICLAVCTTAEACIYEMRRST